MPTGLYAGSFNLIHKGHEHIIRVASGLFDELIVGLGDNVDKKYEISSEVRMELIIESINMMGLKNVTVKHYNGLLCDAARDFGADVIVRGLRTITDFEYEFTLNDFNKTFEPNLETLFLMAPKEFLTISSTNVRAAAKAGKCVRQWVSPHVDEFYRSVK